MTANPNLLRDRRYWPIFWTQFLGAFNDNVFKNAIVILITFKGLSLGSISPEQMVALCGGIFILPFFLFSATAGQLADRYSKSRIVVLVKVWEVLIMLVGAWGFIADSINVLLITLFFMGLQSTFFGPVKYSILPQILHRDELVSGTAYVEMGTFLAILLGTILGGVLIAVPNHGPYMVGIAVIALAGFGCLTAVMVNRLDPVEPGLKVHFNPVTPTFQIMKLTAAGRTVFWSILGISWFWFLGAAVLSLLPPYCKEFLHAEELVVTLFLAIFSIGVGAGSILYDRLSSRKLELGLVPVGSLGMSLFILDIFLVGQPHFAADVAAAGAGAAAGYITIPMLLSTLQGWRIVLDFLLFSIFSGLFIVPLYTIMQQRTAAGERSRIIAGNNIINALFMVVSAVFLMALLDRGHTVLEIFSMLAILNLLAVLCMTAAVPEFAAAFVSWLAVTFAWRVEVRGRENIPGEGPVLLVFGGDFPAADREGNREDRPDGGGRGVSEVFPAGWLIVANLCKRPVRFAASAGYLRNAPFGFVLRGTGAVALDEVEETDERERRPGGRLQADKSVGIIEELKRGGAVCIIESEMEDRMPVGRKGPGRSIPDRPKPNRPALHLPLTKIIEAAKAPVVPISITRSRGDSHGPVQERGTQAKTAGNTHSPSRRPRISVVIGKPIA